MSASRSNTGEPTSLDNSGIKSSKNNAIFRRIIRQFWALFGISRRDGLNSYSQLPLVQHRAGYEISSIMSVRSEELTGTDFIIALMGPTGAGKSTFIQKTTGQDNQNSGVGHSLASYTSEVTAVRISFTDGINVVLVDTPGFDDTYLSDSQVLEIIAKWLKDASRYELCGILYLHRISDNRMSITPSKSLAMFQKLCGADCFEKVILMTTMWPEDEESADWQPCVVREEELQRDYWAIMIARGSTTLRFKNVQESAWSIIDHLITRESRKQWIQIQEELVDQGKKLVETEAGQQLRRENARDLRQLDSVQHRAGYEISSIMPVRSEELTETDFIIALMGPTGTGKSTFIQKATGQDNQNSGVGHGLEPCTSEVTALRISFTDGINVVLVDTPGFDDTSLSDLQVLKIIEKWLKDASRYELCGILYLRRISDNRMSVTPSKNLIMYEKLCGADVSEKVILMTTMWPEDEESADWQPCVVREGELQRDYWAIMIARGSTTLRFENTQESAWGIIDHLIINESKKQWIRIQEELVDQGKKLVGTEAGQQLHRLTGELVQRQTDLLRRMTEEQGETDDPKILLAFLAELRELRKEKQKATRDLRQLDSSIVGTFRRIRIPKPNLKIFIDKVSDNKNENESKGGGGKDDNSTGGKDRGGRGRNPDGGGHSDDDTNNDGHDRGNKGENAHIGGNGGDDRNDYQSNNRSGDNEGEDGASGRSSPPNSPPRPLKPIVGADVECGGAGIKWNFFRD